MPALLDKVREPGMLESLREAVREIFGVYVDRDRPDPWQVAREIVQLGPSAVEPLLDCLGDGDENVVGSAARALGRLGDARAGPPLVTLLTTGATDCRRAAAEGLGLLGHREAVPALIDALASEAPWEAFAGVVGLGAVASPEAVEALKRVRRRGDGEPRSSAQEAIGRIRRHAQGAPGVTEPRP